MKGCLLCLEIRQDLVESIQKDSTKWQEFNIENLIVKHFWPMVSKNILSTHTKFYYFFIFHFRIH